MCANSLHWVYPNWQKKMEYLSSFEKAIRY
jgi:hypothetical protein